MNQKDGSERWNDEVAGKAERSRKRIVASGVTEEPKGRHVEGQADKRRQRRKKRERPE